MEDELTPKIWCSTSGWMRWFDCDFKEVFKAAIPNVSLDRRVVIENALSRQMSWICFGASRDVSDDAIQQPRALISALPHLQFSTLHGKTLSNRAHLASEFSVSGWRSEAINLFLDNVHDAFCSQLTGLPAASPWIVLMAPLR